MHIYIYIIYISISQSAFFTADRMSIMRFGPPIKSWVKKSPHPGTDKVQGGILKLVVGELEK